MMFEWPNQITTANAGWGPGFRCRGSRRWPGVAELFSFGQMQRAMGNRHPFMSRECGRDDYDPSNRGTFHPNLVGVSMPFEGKEWDDGYAVIKEECTKLGLKPQRVDEYVRSGIVIRDITELIGNAEFLIFDLSAERQNVYYELGYAHGVGNEADDILLIARQGTQLHYDIAGLRVHFYDSPDALRAVLSRSLGAMIGSTRK